MRSVSLTKEYGIPKIVLPIVAAYFLTTDYDIKIIFEIYTLKKEK